MPDWNEPIRSRLRPLNLPGARENEIVEELSLHLDDRYAELRRAPRPPTNTHANWRSKNWKVTTCWPRN